MNIIKDKKERLLYYVAADLLLINGNKILLQRRANTGWNDGRWNLIGGHIEENETPIDCIIREAKEELGIKINKEDAVLAHCLQSKEERYTFQFYVVCKKWTGTPCIQPEIENGKVVYKADKLSWFGLDDLPKNLIERARQGITKCLQKEKFSTIGFNDIC